MSSLLLGFVLLLGCFCNTEAVRVTVEQGELEGQLLDAVVGGNQYYSFKGIPYAAPPVGSLRFKAPQPAEPWDGVRNATAHASYCIQHSVFTFSTSGAEDCLYLNVYTPNITPETPLPVMFFIHGGGFFEGNGDVDVYGPDHLVRRDVVVVTFNYRLHAFGFLSLDTKDVPGNAGMKDQVAALKWVQKNIISFGGNPDEVTILGESAGSVAVGYLMVSPMSKGLFNKAIMLSGVPLNDWCVTYLPRERSFKLGKLLGNDTEDPDMLLQFLETVPAENIAPISPRLSLAETMYNPTNYYSFVPSPEKDFGQERFLVEEFKTTLKNLETSDIPLIIGYNNEESVRGIPAIVNQTFIDSYKAFPELFVPRKIVLDSTTKQVLEMANIVQEHFFEDKNNASMREFITYLSEYFLTVDVLRHINFISKFWTPENIFVYRFSCFSDRNIYGKAGLEYSIQGAAHMDGLAYLFEPVASNLTTSLNSTEYELIERITTLFSNFAKYGHPTPDDSFNVTWPTYDVVNKSYLEIRDELSIENSPGADMLSFWKTVYEYSGLETFGFD